MRLAPGGVLIVDGWVRPDQWQEGRRVDHELFEDDQGAIVRFVNRWREGTTTILELHYLGGLGDEVFSFMERHELTLFTADQYRDAFARAGLTFEVVPGPMPERDRYIGVRSGGDLGR